MYGKIRVLTEEEIQHIIKLYIEDKFSTNTISEIMHLNKKKIYEVLEANEITLRKKGELNTKIDKEAVKTFNRTQINLKDFIRCFIIRIN